MQSGEKPDLVGCWNTLLNIREKTLVQFKNVNPEISRNLV